MSDGGTRETIRQDLEQFWDSKLRKARKRYFRAAAEYHRQILEHAGTPPESAPVTAGVVRAEAEAFADYCRVLATFTEVVSIGSLSGPGQPAC